MLQRFKQDGRPLVGLALGGGGARGFAHLGVIKILAEAQIPIDLICGTSMGALLGALYIQVGSAELAEERLRRVLKIQDKSARLLSFFSSNRKGDHFLDYVAERIQQRIIINLSITRSSLLTSRRLQHAVHELIDEVNIEDLSMRFAAMASDLVDGKGVLLTRGSLRKAIIASSSLPGFFPPFKAGKMLLVDGEATNLIPVEACLALGADFVLAVDVTPEMPPMPRSPHSLDLLMRSVRITNRHLAQSTLQRADFVLRPVRDSIPWADFDRLNELISAGEECARAHLPELVKALANFERKTARQLSQNLVEIGCS